MWPSVRPSHPSIQLASHLLRLHCTILHSHSLAASVLIRSLFAALDSYHPHCCCCYSLCCPVNETDRDLLWLGGRPTCCIWNVAGGSGHRYGIRSRSCSLLRDPPLSPLQRSTHVPFHSIPRNLVRFPDRAGSTLGTEVSRRYTHADCRSEATASRRQLLSHPLIILTVEAETSSSCLERWSDGPTAALLIPVASTARRECVRV